MQRPPVVYQSTRPKTKSLDSVATRLINKITKVPGHRQQVYEVSERSLLRSQDTVNKTDTKLDCAFAGNAPFNNYPGKSAKKKCFSDQTLRWSGRPTKLPRGVHDKRRSVPGVDSWNSSKECHKNGLIPSHSRFRTNPALHRHFILARKGRQTPMRNHKQSISLGKIQ